MAALLLMVKPKGGGEGKSGYASKYHAARKEFAAAAPPSPHRITHRQLEAKLIVELDGTHHDESLQQDHHTRRTWWLELQGSRVLRFLDEQIDTEWPAAAKAIRNALRPT